ncbi:MAG: sialate O-acetylesterase [Bacteroidota bacterium]|nr:sialate O-acetylesterase [Bacteroidota bacterium]
MKQLLVFVFCIPLYSIAQLRLDKMFGDHMVLQREQPVRFFGKANPGMPVQVSFAGTTKEVIAGADSSWSILFKKQKADSHPQDIIIISNHQILLLKDVLIGDVWICSGQSNMEFPLQREMHYKEEIKQTLQPLIRIKNHSFAGKYVYGVAYKDSINSKLNVSDFYDGSWQVCDSNSVKPMSAVSYYFAKSIVQNEQVPIGIINLAIGGAPIETFISKEVLKQNKQFASKLKGNWLDNEALPEWCRKRGKENLVRNLHPIEDEMGPNHAYKPGFAFDAGIRPLLFLPVKGVIWYQGESNSLEWPRVIEYKSLMHVLIDDYRKNWNNPFLPFYWVQLSSIDTAYYRSVYWPVFRDEQRKLIKEVSHGGMAVISDIGFKNDVHPTNKKDVGERLARLALHDSYKKRSIVPSGPLPVKATYNKGAVYVYFTYTGGALKTTGAQVVHGFSIDAVHEVGAFIEGKRIKIPVAEKPPVVYYGWKPFSDGNLVNELLLPASTFSIHIK